MPFPPSRRRIVGIVGAVAVAAAVCGGVTALSPAAADAAPASATIVVLKSALHPDQASATPATVAQVAKRNRVGVSDSASAGAAFLTRATPAQARSLKSDPAVAMVVSDQVFTVPTQEQGTHTLHYQLDPSRAGGADKAWSALGTQGAGTVIGVIDTGVATTDGGLRGDALGLETTVDGVHATRSDFNANRTATTTFDTVNRTFTGTCPLSDAGGVATVTACNSKVISAKVFGSGLAEATDAPELAAGESFDSLNDVDGHGTTVARVAAGEHESVSVAGEQVHVTGAAPQARIASYKACFATLAGNAQCDAWDLVDAVLAAYFDYATVVNLSVVIPDSNPGATFGLDQVIDTLSTGLNAPLVVTAAGNDGYTGGHSAHGSPGALTVGATFALADENDRPQTQRLAAYSSPGPASSNVAADQHDFLGVDVVAPGGPFVAREPDGGYDVAYGTSFAAPQAAGAAALLAVTHPQWSGLQLKSALMTSGDPVNDEAGQPLTDALRIGGGALDTVKADVADLTLAPTAEQLDDLAYGVPFGAGSDYFRPRAPWDIDTPSLVNDNTFAQWRVNRTFTAAEGGTYRFASSVPGFDVSAEVDGKAVTTIEVARQARQQVTFVFHRTTAANGAWTTGNVSLVAAAPQLDAPATITLPVALRTVDDPSAAPIEFVSSNTIDLRDWTVENGASIAVTMRANGTPTGYRLFSQNTLPGMTIALGQGQQRADADYMDTGEVQLTITLRRQAPTQVGDCVGNDVGFRDGNNRPYELHLRNICFSS